MQLNSKTGVLGGTCTYLAGPMQFAKDRGVGWRQLITPRLKDFGIIIFSPTEMAHNVEEAFKKLKECKDLENWDSFTDIMKQYRRLDLRCVDKSDFLIAKIDTSIHMCGTYHEIIEASKQQKPILVFNEQGKKTMPDWLFTLVNHNHMFDSLDELCEFLASVNEGKENLKILDLSNESI